MEFNGEVIKKGTAQVNNYLLEFSVSFDANNNPLRTSVRVLEGSTLVAQASYKGVRNMISVAFVDVDKVTPGNRIEIYTAIEKELVKIFP